MANDAKQLIEDYSDSPPDKSALLWMQINRCRLAWLATLAICPSMMISLKFIFVNPAVSRYVPKLCFWHAQAVSILIFVHLGLSALAMVASVWVWGRNMVPGWAFVFLILYLTGFIAAIATIRE